MTLSFYKCMQSGHVTRLLVCSQLHRRPRQQKV